MVQAQGVRPADPYRILQLHPAAPRELIVEAYWTLVRRPRRPDASDAGIRADDIGAAYAILIDPARRRALDAALGIDGDASPKSRAADYYETLCVDAEADARIIEMAYRLLSRDEDQKKRSARRFSLDEAYRALSNPPLRAQYDATRRPPTRNGPMLLADTAPQRRAQPAKPPKRGLFGRRQRRGEPLDGRDSRLLTLRESAVRWDVAQGDGLHAPAAGDDVVAELVMMGGPHAGRRLPLGAQPVAMGGTLRDHVLLDPGLPPEAILVWHQGERTMMKHVIAADVLINDAPPALAILVLEDGDTITVAGHVMRYHRFSDG